jgi:hypothetical protein
MTQRGCAHAAALAAARRLPAAGKGIYSRSTLEHRVRVCRTDTRIRSLPVRLTALAERDGLIQETEK